VIDYKICKYLALIQQQDEKSAEDNKKGRKDDILKSNINDFFTELAELKDAIAKIKTYIEEIQGLHDRTLNNVTSEKQNAGNP
jgi:predicted  nucleic acid-binding Zn-ribbon protein